MRALGGLWSALGQCEQSLRAHRRALDLDPLRLVHRIAYARSLADGAPVWQQTLAGELNSTPIQVDGKLIVAAMTGDILLSALDPANGQVIWSFTPQK